MTTNQFKPFATGPGANIVSQNDWETLPALLNGFTAGKASSAQINKALRQTSFIAAALAEFVSEKSGHDVLDDGDVAGFVAKLSSGIAADYLSRENPFADIKADGNAAVSTALTNLGLGASAPAIGIPFFWPSTAMPNTVMSEWADMIFLKFNGATFSAITYPKLALVIPSLTLTEARGEFLRIWDDGRGVDVGRSLLTAQSDDFKKFTLKYLGPAAGTGTTTTFALQTGKNPIYTSGISQGSNPEAEAFQVPGGAETRPRNIAFNFLVRAK